jgi:hypothetical protein
MTEKKKYPVENAPVVHTEENNIELTNKEDKQS